MGEEEEEEEEVLSAQGPETPEGDSWHTPDQPAAPRQQGGQRHFQSSEAAVLLERLAGVSSLEMLSSLMERYDVDAYSLLFEGETALEALDAALSGERHPIDPLGTDYAKQRGLYEPNTFAMVGLAQPKERLGMGICLARNRCAVSIPRAARYPHPSSPPQPLVSFRHCTTAARVVLCAVLASGTAGR